MKYIVIPIAIIIYLWWLFLSIKDLRKRWKEHKAEVVYPENLKDYTVILFILHGGYIALIIIYAIICFCDKYWDGF
jgi:hypothetical protein